MSEFVRAPFVRAAERMRAPHLHRVAVAFSVSPTEVRREWAFPDIYDAWLELDARAVGTHRAREEAKNKHG